ncbi:MAG TPA: hypothetical protein DCP63_06405 [Bacteroidetes bacterium]|nr:hypothetical protein [Bacteroidota bacterium]
MNPPIRILHLEDNPKDAELVEGTLEIEGIDHETTVVSTRPEFVQKLKAGGFDIIISDFNLPDFDGLQALSIAREVAPDLPFIFLSGTLGEDRAVEAMRNGATTMCSKTVRNACQRPFGGPLTFRRNNVEGRPSQSPPRKRTSLQDIHGAHSRRCVHQGFGRTLCVHQPAILSGIPEKGSRRRWEEGYGTLAA